MTDTRFPVEGNYFVDLLRQNSELYVTGVNVNGHPGRVYEVVSREPGKLDGFYIGDLEHFMICGVQFEDSGKRAMLKSYLLGILRRGDLGNLANEMDPEPEGDYLLKVIGIGGDDELQGFGQKYTLESNQQVGDIYRVILFFKEIPKVKVRETVLLS